MDDEQIIELFWQRSEDAITALDVKYGRLCHALSYQLTNNQQDAEECVNDAYLGIWNAIPPARPHSLSAYLCKIVRNLSLKKHEHKSAAKRDSQYDVALEELAEILPGSEDVWSNLAAQTLSQALEHFLDTLSQENRVIFVRRYWFGDSYQTIAGQVHKSEKNVSVRLTRLRKQLRQYLIQEGIL